HEIEPRVLAQPVYLFAIRSATAYRPRVLHTLGIKSFSGENPPYGAGIYLYLREARREEPVVTITNQAGNKVAELKAGKAAGLQRLSWRLAPSGTPQGTYSAVPAGTYTAAVRIGDISVQRPFQVEVDD